MHNFIVCVAFHVLDIIFAVGSAEGHGICVGDKLLEVNGCSVRGCTHQQAGALFNDSPQGRVNLLVHSIKPAPKPSGAFYNMCMCIHVVKELTPFV